MRPYSEYDMGPQPPVLRIRRAVFMSYEAEPAKAAVRFWAAERVYRKRRGSPGTTSVACGPVSDLQESHFAHEPLVGAIPYRYILNAVVLSLGPWVDQEYQTLPRN